jgi:hypothetical protein
MLSQLLLSQYTQGHLMGTRSLAKPLREKVEKSLDQGLEVALNFSGISATQSFIDELIGGLILRRSPDVLDQLIFKSCSEDVRAIIEFVTTDRCDQYLKQHSGQAMPYSHESNNAFAREPYSTPPP